MKLRRTRKAGVSIPTASISDIAMLLLIFFIVTSIFRKETGLRIVMPSARTTERLIKQRKLEFVWVDGRGNVSVNDRLTPVERLETVFKIRRSNNPDLITVIKGDVKAPYGTVDKILKSLQQAESYRVVFATTYRRE